MEVRLGYKQTEVGVIPVEWEAVAIGSLASFTSGCGISVSSLHRHSSNAPVPVFGGNGIAGYTSKPLVRDPVVVVGRVGQKCGEVYLTEGPAWITDNALYPRTILRPLDLRFLALAMKAAGLNEVKNRNDLPLVTQNILHAVRIAWPQDSGEQRAIAEALSDVDALLGALDRLIAKKRDLKQAAMQQLLTGQTRLPGFHGEWEVRSLHEVCQKIQDGTHFSPKLGGNDYLYVTSKNIRSGTLDMSTADRISVAEHVKIYARCDVKKGDLLLTKDGANTGNAALNPLDEPFSLLSSVALLRFDDRRYVAAFFMYQILSAYGQQQIQEMMSGNAITRLTLAKIRALRFPIPPPPEQTAIAEVLSDMDAELATLEQRREKTCALKQAMMQELLTGRTRLV